MMNDRRFRASIYVDIFVPDTDDLEHDRDVATNAVHEYQSTIPNSYVGGVAYFPADGNLLRKFDREI